MNECDSSGLLTLIKLGFIGCIAKHHNKSSLTMIRDTLLLNVKRLRNSDILFKGKLPVPSTQKYIPENARLNYFSEEITRWHVPRMSHAQKAFAMKVIGNQVNVAMEVPVCVHSFENGICSTLHLNDLLPYGCLPQMSSIGDKLAFLLTDQNLLIILSTKTGGDCTIINLPDATNKASRGFSSNFFLNASKSKFQSSLFPGSFRENNSIIVSMGGKTPILDLVTMHNKDYVVDRIHLPQDLKVDRVEPLVDDDTWLIQSGSSRSWMKRTENNEFSLSPMDSRKLSFEEIVSASPHLDNMANSISHAAKYIHPEKSHLVPGHGSQHRGVFSNESAYLQYLQDAGTGEMSMMTIPYSDEHTTKRVVISRNLAQTQKVATVALEANIGGQGMIQLIDSSNKIARVIHPVPMASASQVEWISADVTEDGRLVTLQQSSTDTLIRLWETEEARLDSEFQSWSSMIGKRDDKLYLHQRAGSGGESTKPPPIDTPKHGKEDPKNVPHVGGNTWAGGTGGSNTAGLGGRGGPYRLDKGHPVHQVTEASKLEVDELTRQKARELNRSAFAKRLEEIQMTEQQNDQYMSFLNRVETEIQQLRNVLDSLESRKQERVWLKNQSHGDLDDSRLVDGITGERMIYKRRGLNDPTNAVYQEKPKRLQFVVDCSGSMYRFNGQDGRLERECELVVMVMEALEGFGSRFEYSIVGHSGEEHSIPFVEFGSPPTSRKERYQVVMKMIAHSQYCWSGDMTLEATEAAVLSITDEEADEYFVFVVSDANLRRYGIQPRILGNKLMMNPEVNAFVFFIAGLGQEAERSKNELPPGRAFVVNDTADLPPLFREILMSKVIS